MLIFCHTDSREGLTKFTRYGKPLLQYHVACSNVGRTNNELRSYYVMWPMGIGDDNIKHMQAYGIPVVGRYTQCLDEYGMRVLGSATYSEQC